MNNHAVYADALSAGVKLHNWCWHCSNAGVGGNQPHSTVEHEQQFYESMQKMLENEERRRNHEAHEAWLARQPAWNPLWSSVTSIPPVHANEP